MMLFWRIKQLQLKSVLWDFLVLQALLTQMCSHIALWHVVVTDAPRPPVCSSSASCQHLDSAVSTSEMMPTYLWCCLLFNLCQGGALLFKAPDLFTAPPHRRRVLPLLLVLLVMSRLLFFLLSFSFSYFLDVFHASLFTPTLSSTFVSLPHGSFSQPVYFFTDSCQTPHSCRDIISSWYELSQ